MQVWLLVVQVQVVQMQGAEVGMLRASVHRGSSRLTAAALARPAPAVGGVRRLTDREPRPGPPATRPGACGGARTAELSPLTTP